MTSDEKSASDCDREAIESAMREARIAQGKRDETLAWAYERAAAREAAEREAAKPKPARQRSAPATLTDDWVRYIRQEIAQHSQDMVWAIGASIGKDLVIVERDVAALRERVIALEGELTELRARLEQERGGPRIRAVPTSPEQLIA